MNKKNCDIYFGLRSGICVGIHAVTVVCQPDL